MEPDTYLTYREIADALHKLFDQYHSAVFNDNVLKRHFEQVNKDLYRLYEGKVEIAPDMKQSFAHLIELVEEERDDVHRLADESPTMPSARDDATLIHYVELSKRLKQLQERLLAI
jgi:hypothetical protein